MCEYVQRSTVILSHLVLSIVQGALMSFQTTLLIFLSGTYATAGNGVRYKTDTFYMCRLVSESRLGRARDRVSLTVTTNQSSVCMNATNHVQATIVIHIY